MMKTLPFLCGTELLSHLLKKTVVIYAYSALIEVITRDTHLPANNQRYFKNGIFSLSLQREFNKMNRRIINKLKKALPAYPIEKAWIFGSYSRGEETRKSDIDIMVRFDKNADISLFDYIRIMHGLRDTLHKKVDLVEEGQLRRWAQESVEQDKILVYERAN